MKLKLTGIVAAVALLAGCSTAREYQVYADAQRARVQAEAMVEAARWNALAEVAKSGDVTAKVAVAMAVQAGGKGGAGGANPAQGIAPPKSNAELALQWTGLILPNLTQFYAINRNSAVAMRQSDNATALGIAQSNNQTAVAKDTNATFGNMAAAGLSTASTIASNGFAGMSNVAGAGLTAVTTVSGQGTTALTSIANNSLSTVANVAGQGTTALTSVANTSSNAMVSVSASHSNAVISLSNAIPNVQPNVTTTTTTNATTTTNNNLTCPVGQTLTNGTCQ